MAQTEVKNNDLNPDFGAIKLKYWFEKKQMLRFEIKDSDKGIPNKSMGYIETTMGKIMGAKS